MSELDPSLSVLRWRTSDIFQHSPSVAPRGSIRRGCMDGVAIHRSLSTEAISPCRTPRFTRPLSPNIRIRCRCARQAPPPCVAPRSTRLRSRHPCPTSHSDTTRPAPRSSPCRRLMRQCLHLIPRTIGRRPGTTSPPPLLEPSAVYEASSLPSSQPCCYSRTAAAT